MTAKRSILLYFTYAMVYEFFSDGFSVKHMLKIFTCLVLRHKIHHYMSHKLITKLLHMLKMVVANKCLNETAEVVRDKNRNPS